MSLNHNHRPGNGADKDGIRDKVVLVTGSGHGLGAHLAGAAAENRARVVINCRADSRRAEALGQDIQKRGGHALVCRADVTDYGEAQDLVAETVRAFGRVDMLINTVGGFSWKPVAETDPTEWRSIVASNCSCVSPAARGAR